MNHLHLKTPDPKQTADFYVEYTGAKVLKENTRPDGSKNYRLDLHGVELNVTEFLTEQKLSQFYGLEHVAIDTNNFDGEVTKIKSAGLKIPADIQGRSFAPLLRGEKPKGWRTAMYYRYYHDPGDHNTASHYGVRTLTHKLIYYWKKNQWELYDLHRDPNELRNIYNDPTEKKTIEKLKKEMFRLKKELKDDDEFANEQPPNGVDKKVPGQKQQLDLNEAAELK